MKNEITQVQALNFAYDELRQLPQTDEIRNACEVLKNMADVRQRGRKPKTSQTRLDNIATVKQWCKDYKDEPGFTSRKVAIDKGLSAQKTAAILRVGVELGLLKVLPKAADALDSAPATYAVVLED